MPVLSDAYFARLLTTLSDLRTLLSQIPPEQSTPILARLAELEHILSAQKPPT